MWNKKILIADAHSVIRAGLKHILGKKFSDLEFGEAATGAQLLKMVKKENWDALILDTNLPDRMGLEMLKQMKDEGTRIPVLVFSLDNEEHFAIRALKAGAAGFLPKDAAEDELISAVDQVLSGRKYVSASVAALLVSQAGGYDKTPHDVLSDREYQTLIMIASGKSISQIAEELSLSVPTISTYRARILQKMGLKNNAEITYYAIHQKLT
jgi:two-component system, NarL family, invasion response regulator UvrY